MFIERKKKKKEMGMSEEDKCEGKTARHTEKINRNRKR